MSRKSTRKNSAAQKEPAGSVDTNEPTRTPEEIEAGRQAALAEIENAEREEAAADYESAGMDGELLDGGDADDDEGEHDEPAPAENVNPLVAAAAEIRAEIRAEIEAEEPAAEEVAEPAEVPAETPATPEPAPEKKEAVDLIGAKNEPPPPEGVPLIVVRPSANKFLVWAHFKDRPRDGLVRLQVRSASYYRQGEEVMARELARGLWEAVTHRNGPKQRFRRSW